MNVFRLVLCLAGLTIYLVVKQFLHTDPALGAPGGALPGRATPVPGAQQAFPRTPRPQTNPHIEILKASTSYAAAAKTDHTADASN